MVSTYFELATTKSDLGVTGVGLDTNFNDWSDKIEAYINNKIFEVWSKRRSQVTLPDLPLTGADITQTIKNAENAGVKSKYYEVEQRDEDLKKSFFDEMNTWIDQFVREHNIKKKIYGRVIT